MAKRFATQGYATRREYIDSPGWPAACRLLVQRLVAALITSVLLGSFLLLYAACSSGTVPPSGQQTPTAISWKEVSSPSPGTAGSAFNHVAVLSMNDAWALGYSINDIKSGSLQTLIEHWDGQHWSVTASPNPGTFANNLLGGAVVSTNDAWAVGSFSNDAKKGTPQPLIEHWDGQHWSVVPNPDLQGRSGVLYAVAASSASDAWAVGYFVSTETVSGVVPRTYQVEEAMIEHWDGRHWSLLNNVIPNSSLAGVVTLSASDAWAVGQTLVSGPKTLIEHWDGKQWNVVASPNPGEDGNSLNSLTAVSANDIWAVGYQYGFTPGSSSLHTWDTLVEHWNGKQWSVVRSPNLGTMYNSFNDVAALAANDIWAVGSFSNDGDWQKLANLPMLLEHWDGQHWSVISVHNAAAGITSLVGVASVPQARSLWMVGSFATTVIDPHTLARTFWYSEPTT